LTAGIDGSVVAGSGGFRGGGRVRRGGGGIGALKSLAPKDELLPRMAY
jgi:hypothetical protein